jgi:hypothetical protein
MSLTIEPLKKEIYNKAISLGVTQIKLRFSGGNDEGFLDVEVQPWNQAFAHEVEAWAWDVYDYNGAGDGSDYGDDITYDLVNKKATTQEWYTACQDGEEFEESLDVSK